MERKTHLYLFAATITVLFLAVNAYSAKPIYSSRLIHRFSDEAHGLGLWGGKSRNNGSTKTMSSWPERKSFGQMRMLLGSDLRRQRLKLGAQNQLLVASQGSQTFDYGNDLGWLHYTWIDIGTPKTSFLVALDTGSDMSWVPCQCMQCAPLSPSKYYMLDKELGEYDPSHSTSSKGLPCSHELCTMGPNCKTPESHCPYTVNYLSKDTSSSGFLFEDKLHLASVQGNKPQNTVQASVIIGCGSKQSGGYLDGIAPDGLMGLGPGDISIPSLLAKSRLVSRSFSFCFDKSYSGTLFFGDEGPISQKSTSFLPLKENPAYIVEVETYCIGNSCLKQTGYKAQVDTGCSFTYLPSESYEKVVSEFDRQAKATRITTQGFDYCYRLLKVPNFPSLKLVFSGNQSFVVENPWLHIVDEQGDLHCLGIHPMDGDVGIIGQNFLMGYRMVFDWERLKLGWSISNNCQDIGADNVTPSPSNAPPNPLPATEQQRNPHGNATAPAVAGRTSPKPSVASPLLVPAPCNYVIVPLLLLLCTVMITYLI